MARIPKWGQQLKQRIETGEGYQYKNEGDKAKWRGTYLKNLSKKQYGSSYDDKLTTFVKSMGGDEKEAKQFRTWMNQRESGELQKNIDYQKHLSKIENQNEENKRNQEQFGNLVAQLKSVRGEKPDPGWEWDKFGKSFTRSSGKIIDTLTPFTDPVQNGLIKDMNKHNWFNEGTRNFLNDSFKEADTKSQKILDTVSEVGGSVGSVGGAYKIADKTYDALNGVSKLLKPMQQYNKALPKGMPTINDLQRGSAAGALWGVQNEANKALNGEDVSLGRAALNISAETALGGLGDAAITGAGQLIRRLRNARRTPTVNTIDNAVDDVAEQIAPTIETPVQSVNTPPRDIEFDKAVEEQYNYLKSSLANRRGVQQGGLIRNDMGEVVDRYGRISENPGWYQDFYRVNNRQPTNQDLRELAEQHVRNGFRDEFGEIPAYEAIKASDNPKVQEIDNSIKELQDLLRVEPSQEPAIRPLIQALEQEKQAILSKEQYMNIDAYKDSGVPMKRVDTTKPQIDHTKGNADTFRGKIDRKPKKEKSQFFQTMRTQFIDDVAPLENLEKKIAGKVESAENSLYKQARLSKGSPEKANLIVKEQIHPIIRDVQKQGKSLEDLGDYALAVHARDVNEKGINSGFTNKEIEDVIKKLGTPQMEEARKKLIAVNNNVLDMLSSGDSPVLSPDDVKAMREKWPNYMSLFRSFDDDKVEFASGLSKALSVASSPIKKLEGSSRRVIDPMESVVKNIFKATSVADRNNAASKLGRLANIDKEGKYIRKLADGEDAGRLNVISVMNKGNKERYEVPPDVYKAMKNLDKESTNTLVTILQKPASMLRAGATLTPEFSLRNWIRDVPQAYVTSNSGFNPFVDFPVGLWQAIWKGRTIKIGGKEFKTSGDLYKQFIKENGGYGNIISMDRELHRETLKKALTEANTSYVDILSPKTYKALIKELRNPLNPLRKIADISETATKVGEFRAALRKGVSPQEAAYRARDVMDFGRAGVSVREANKVVAFLNANIQGKSKLWRAFKENPVRWTGKAFTAVTLPTLGALYAQETLSNDKQRKVLDDAPQWLKDTFYLIPIPGTDQIARIPKPFDLAYPFANVFERAFEYAKKNDKEAFDNFIREGLSASALPVMLTGIAPIIEGMANYSFFQQGRIIPQREDNVDFPQQYDINTSEVAKMTGKGINALTGGEGAFRNFGSPRVVDNTIRGLTGGLGVYAANAVDFFLEKSGAVDKPEKADKQINQQPVVRSFLVNQGSTGESVGKLYDMLEKMKRQRGTANEQGETFTNESKYKELQKITKEISEITKEMREVENSTSLNGREKRTQLDRLNQERNDLARRNVDRFK